MPKSLKPPTLDRYKYCVFAGAGAAGPAYVGAFNELWKRGYARNIEGIGGTSAGSIVALGCALGYRGTELEDIVMNQNFSHFLLKVDWHDLINLKKSVKERAGILTGKEIRRWGEEMIARRLGTTTLTFGEWQEYCDAAKRHDDEFFRTKFEDAQEKLGEVRRRLKRPEFKYSFDTAEDLMRHAAEMVDFRVMGARVVNKEGREEIRKRVFSAATTPHTSVAQAVKASAGFPFIFRRSLIEGEYFTDAGAAESIPFSLFEPPGHHTGKTLGLDVQFITKDQPIKPGPKRFVNNIIKTFMGEASLHDRIENAMTWLFTKPKMMQIKQHLIRSDQRAYNNPEMLPHIIVLDRGNVRAPDFLKAGPDEKRWLMDSGARGVDKAINDFEKHQERIAQSKQHIRQMAKEQKKPLKPDFTKRIIGQRRNPGQGRDK